MREKSDNCRGNRHGDSHVLGTFAGARAMDKEASQEWGLNPFALVEAAGRACADAFISLFHAEAIFFQNSSRKGAKALRVKRYLQASRHSPRLWGSARDEWEKFSDIVVLAGTGNNAADALVMLRMLVLENRVSPDSCVVFISRLPEDGALTMHGSSPYDSAILAVRMLGITVTLWDEEKAAGTLASAGFVIDGIAGTGLDGPLGGGPQGGVPPCEKAGTRRAAFQMAEAVNALRGNRGPAAQGQGNQNRPCIVSVDIPSGIFDGWRPGMPAVEADITLAIEPEKMCIYTPAARPLAGKIIHVGGIFPGELVGKYREADLVYWETASKRIPRILETVHKYTRGLVEIRAGSSGAAGAAKLAALGAQAAGAGLVRLLVDPSLYPVIAPACSGVMVVPDGSDSRAAIGNRVAGEGRFSPAAVLLGPGWGKGEDRRRLLETYLPLEEQGLPLILDADAIFLAKDIVFHGNAVLTPHAGEFAEYTGISKDDILAAPVPILRRFASEKKVHILFKSHVLYAVSPDGRVGIIDGMNPLLAAGGTGDVLAGFCASVAARWRAIAIKNGAAARGGAASKGGAAAGSSEAGFDGHACMCAAASLLIKAAKTKKVSGRFVDPEKIARAAAVIAGKAWLPESADKEEW